MESKYSYLIGTKVGKWSVGKYVKGGKFECECECGAIKNVSGSALNKGTSTQCKECSCKMSIKHKMDIGDKFGHWEVIGEIHKKQYKNTLLPVVLCRCSCGIEKELIIYNIINKTEAICSNCNAIAHAKLATKKKIELARENNIYKKCEDYYELHINNKIVLFDDVDYVWIKKYTWRIVNNYVVTGDFGENYLKMHNRIIELDKNITLCNDDFPDHINRNTLDNRRHNFNIVDKYESNQNRGMFKNNKTGIKGVSFRDGTWLAHIGYNNKSISLGSFINKQDAINARLKAEDYYWSYIKDLKESDSYIDENIY